jgi:NADH-quinone oxidoreductase subunit L
VLLLIPLLPFLGFLVNAAYGRRLSKAVSGGLACSTIGGSFVISVIEVVRLVAMAPDERSIVQQGFNWITSGDFSVGLTFRLDPLSAVMILVITGIGLLIHIYSTAYMHDERDSEYARYFSYLNLFAAFMLVLVLGSNFLVMFVGWEGVSARISSSGSGTRRSPPPTRARRHSSSTGSATGGSCSACCSCSCASAVSTSRTSRTPWPG